MTTNRYRIGVAAILVAVCALSFASPASAFIRLTRAAASGTGVVQAHWFDSELPLLSVIDATNSDISYAQALSIAQASAKTWENVNTSYFTVNPVDWTSGPFLPPALNAGDHQNSLFFDQAGVNFAPGSGVIAFVRSIISSTDGHTLDADLVFNDKEFFCSTTSPAIQPSPPGQTSVDLQSVLTHEYGHYFGLDHTSIANATMIPFILNSTDQRTLELDDQAGISTIFPESAARGLSPGGVDFFATTGKVSGTVVSGFTGAAIFGAHVEAINIANPVPEASISAISGELTLRNGQGDFTIYGLPPGSYAIRIVPLDGIHTIASDANIGGVFNGLDINFEPEFWNGANEGGNGFLDHANDFTPVSVAANATSSGIGFITNTFPGQVEIAQSGAFENFVTDRSNSYRAVRFDPPFDPPYTITKVSFPTFTFNGVPAHFTSVSLVPMNPVNGTPDLSSPLFTMAPFSGSANGVNDVPVNVTVNDPGKTFFWVMRWPPRPASFPNNHPFVFMDFSNMEKGLFGNSYSTATLTGPWSLNIDRNITVSMFCQMGSPDMTPIEASSNTGANRRVTKVDFSFDPSPDVRADGFPMAANSLFGTNLLRRPVFGAWGVDAQGGAGSSTISMDSIPNGIWLWSTQSVDKAGHKAIGSNITITGFNEDGDEPNGRLNEAKVLTPPVSKRPETYAPAGDQDYYTFNAKVGDVIDASASATGLDGINDLDLVMFLFDTNGDIVAFNDDFTGLNPRVVFSVPPPSTNSKSNAPRKFSILVTDIRHSLLSPTSAPRVLSPETYTLSVSVTTPPALAGRLSRGMNGDGYGFALGGPNPMNPATKLLYVLPRDASGTRVSLRIYDVTGRLVRTLVDRNETAGAHGAVWDGTDQSGRHVSSGAYFARIEAGKFTQQEKVIILK